jgi:glycosyltransferase involved in cell wall biosynthesis
MKIDGEIIIVDNNSSDDSAAMIKTVFRTLNSFKIKKFRFSKRNNIAGISSARRVYLYSQSRPVVPKIPLKLLWLSAKKKQEKSELLEEVAIDGSGNFLPESKENSHHVVAFTKLQVRINFFQSPKCLAAIMHNI